MTVSATLAAVLAGSWLVPASADTPANWESAPDVSALDFLLVVALIPLAAAAVIALLTVLPSLARDRGYQPGQAWRGEAEWFGGPTKGVAAADSVEPAQVESGGTSARW